MSVTADPDAFFNLHMFKAGRVLSEQDVADIQKVLADYNEELESQVDIHEAARTAGLHAIGGDELVKAVHAKDEAATKAIIDKALERFWATQPDDPKQDSGTGAK